MAVGFDAKCLATTEINAVSGATGITSTNLTVGASASCLFAILIFDGSATLTAPAMTWNSVAMTQIGTTVTVSTVGQIMMFGLVSPASGAKTLKATWTGTGTGYMASMSFTGSITSSVAACFTNAVTATPTGPTGTQNITGASGNYAICANGNDNVTYTTFINATSSTLLFSDINNNYAACAYAPEVGATTTFSWAQGSSNENVVAGCTVAAASAGPSGSPTGVTGTSAVGTVIASIGKAPTGVAGTGSAGTVTASVGKAPTGVTGTGSAGTLASSLGGLLTGAAGTGSAGTPIAQNSKTLTGAAGTGGVGTFTGQDSGTMSGVGGTGQVGLDGAKVAANLSGVTGTGQVGVLQGVQGTNGVVTGVGGTGQAGTLTDQVSAAASGVAGTGQSGTETAQTGASIAGIGGTGQAGSLSGGASGGIGGVGGTGQVSLPGIEVDSSVIGVGSIGQAGILTTSSTAAPVIVTAGQGGPGDDDDEASAEARRQKWLEWSRKKRLKEKAKLAVPQPIVAKAEPVAAHPPSASLLERNLHAQRLQIMQQAIADAAAAEFARLQEEDDEEAIALLMDA